MKRLDLIKLLKTFKKNKEVYLEGCDCINKAKGAKDEEKYILITIDD
jgi:hypothetical protein